MTPTALPARPRRILPVLTAVVVQGLTGATASCAGSDVSSSSSTTRPAPPRFVTVRITDGEFDPRQVEVAVGGSVTWVNDDATEHRLASTSPNVIDSPLIGKAGAYTQGFATPGEFRYYCTIHNSMKGVVVVR